MVSKCQWPLGLPWAVSTRSGGRRLRSACPAAERPNDHLHPRFKEKVVWCFSSVLGCGAPMLLRVPGLAERLLAFRLPGGGSLDHRTHRGLARRAPEPPRCLVGASNHRSGGYETEDSGGGTHSGRVLGDPRPSTSPLQVGRCLAWFRSATPGREGSGKAQRDQSLGKPFRPRNLLRRKRHFVLPEFDLHIRQVAAESVGGNAVIDFGI